MAINWLSMNARMVVLDMYDNDGGTYHVTENNRENDYTVGVRSFCNHTSGGYAVACTPGDDVRIEGNLLSSNFQSSVLESIIQNLSKLIALNNRNPRALTQYLGSWKDGDAWVFDAVHIIQDEEEAKRLGHMLNQKAIFNLNTYEEIEL